MDIVKRLRRTRATMLGTDDEQHFSDCHEAADEIERLRHAMLTAARRLEKGGDEYGVGYELRVAMTPNVELRGASRLHGEASLSNAGLAGREDAK